MVLALQQSNAVTYGLVTNSMRAADVIATKLSRRHQLVQCRQTATNLRGSVLQRARLGTGSFLLRRHVKRVDIWAAVRANVLPMACPTGRSRLSNVLASEAFGQGRCLSSRLVTVVALNVANSQRLRIVPICIELARIR